MYNCNCRKILFNKNPVGTCLGEVVDLGFAVDQDGIYTQKLSFLDAEIVLERNLFAGDRATVLTDRLNENYEYVVQMFNPDGTQIKVDTGGEIFDCFSFRTTIKIKL